MLQNKDHWYDGWFYNAMIAPHQDKLFGQILELIDSDSTIIDVGCGTGRLEFTLSGKCKSVLGIDLSKRNIDMAKQTLLKNPNGKISFQHCNINDVIREGINHFDFAVLTYVIHEVDEGERVNLLKDIASVADKIIIGDYAVPGPKWPENYLTEAIEYLAGKEHFRNYKSFVANGGIHDLANKAGLRIMQEIKNESLTNQIVILSNKESL